MKIKHKSSANTVSSANPKTIAKSAKSFQDINIGDKAEFKIKIYEAMHNSFSDLSGDHSPIHCDDQRLDFERLGDKIESPRANGRDSGLEIAERSENDDKNIGLNFYDSLCQRDAVMPGILTSVTTTSNALSDSASSASFALKAVVTLKSFFSRRFAVRAQSSRSSSTNRIVPFIVLLTRLETTTAIY